VVNYTSQANLADKKFKDWSH